MDAISKMLKEQTLDQSDTTEMVSTIHLAEKQMTDDIKALEILLSEQIQPMIAKGEAVRCQLEDRGLLKPQSGLGHFSTICLNPVCQNLVCHQACCSYSYHVHAKWNKGDPIWKSALVVKKGTDEIKKDFDQLEKNLKDHLKMYTAKREEFRSLLGYWKGNGPVYMDHFIETKKREIQSMSDLINQSNDDKVTKTKRLESLQQELQTILSTQTNYYLDLTNHTIEKVTVGFSKLSSIDTCSLSYDTRIHLEFMRTTTTTTTIDLLTNIMHDCYTQNIAIDDDSDKEKDEGMDLNFYVLWFGTNWLNRKRVQSLEISYSTVN
ncbi:hypothetical protein DFA_04782 [Cavenderia fasciculata]|uniref:Uncharacterized protein n=1 Tax=Cavenderia fasciculata TaxID=261658 RepID=F4PQI9_CACFS|nr:uncharacterized protein DFA_04782 [Cavenderia fasciculata]EGG22652.1 hypothetical protein DFA_04782 [Cavenderia fasciculata]|eukprot:XP_004360503.1 hypothetical protein DFA_04782 [Cavenderia fasciculata]